MRNLTTISDYVTGGVDLLKQQFQKEGNFRYLIEVVLEFCQEIENAGQALLTGRYIANATGATLDMIGGIVGMPRPSILTPDTTYRVLIYGKIAANNSAGTIPDLLGVMGALGATQRKIFEVYPASITVNVNRSPAIADCGCVREILTSAKASVAMDLAITEGAGYWGFEGDSNALPIGVGVFAEAG